MLRSICYKEKSVCFENEYKGEKEKMIGSSSVYVLYVISLGGRCYCKVDNELFGKQK